MLRHNEMAGEVATRRPYYFNLLTGFGVGSATACIYRPRRHVNGESLLRQFNGGAKCTSMTMMF